MPVGGAFSNCGCGGGSDCPSLTTPIATTGLCLPDGTPLAVVMERDCSGNVAQTGWLNLTTGAYTTGVPPAGAEACGDSRSIQVSGVFCDVTPDGVVHGLVLTEYHYADDGSIDSVRLVDAATGQTYTLTGQLSICPSGGDGDESPGDLPVPTRQIVERCGCDDTDGDGIGDVRYVELWSVDTIGASAPFLVGTYVDGDFDQPYIPQNPVECPAADVGDESPGEPTRACPPQIMERCNCDDTDGDGLGDVRYVELWAVDPCTPGATPVLLGTWVDGDFEQPYTPVSPVGCPAMPAGDESPGAETCSDCQTLLLCDIDPTSPSTLTAGSGTLANGVGYTVTAPAAFAPTKQGDGAAWWGLGLFPNQITPLTTYTFDQTVTADFSVALVYSADTTPGQNTVQLPSGAQPLSLPPGYTYDRATGVLSVDATVTGCTQLLTPTRDNSARFRVTGVTSFGLKYLGTRVLVPDCRAFGTWLFGAVDVSIGGQFLRTVCRDCDGGVSTITDTMLDGTTPYTPVGEVGVCAGDAGRTGGMQPCRDSATVLVCDIPASDTTTVTPAIVDATSADIGQTQFANLATPYTALWSGGSITYPAGTGPGQQHWIATGRLTATPAGCDQATGTLTVSVRTTQNGPGTGQAWDGALRLYRGTTLLAADDVITYAPPGHVQTLTASVPVTAADLASGDLYVALALEVFQGTAKSWTADQFTASVELQGCEATTATQFLRTLVTDCETGQTVGFTDTTLDGQPYTVSGTVGQCVPASSGDEACGQVQTLALCDTAPDGTVTPFLRTLAYDCNGLVAAVTDTVLDGTTPYATAGTVGSCDQAGADESPGAEPCRNTSTLLVCDLPEDGAPTPTVTDTDPTPYYSDPVAAPVTGAQSLWSGGTLVLPPGTAPQPGTIGTVNTLAATVTAARPGCDDGTATVTASVLVAQTGPDDGCGPTGHLRLFNGTQQIALTVVPANTPVGWSGTLTVTATVPAADLAAGNVAVVLALDAYDGGLTCTPSPRETGWNLSQFTATALYDQITCAQQVLANVITDCATGQVDSVTYTTMNGTPYTPTGQIGQCQPACTAAPDQPCGDTEVATLCDLVYSPQAPIPTPADTFTLTGNVVDNGAGSLWFAQANQDANGVAELTIGGLLPSVMYEFRFQSAFVGSGSPTPATNNAIYLLDILDGTNVLATRTRNLSNGSTAFPGSNLTEDLPPLAFLAPASGSVTIRFTDQTTGGAVNDRDLLIKPLEVRTASLTLTATPFLRAYTFNCDGVLTGSQDTELDGTTAYTVQGEVGTCGGSGDGDGTAVAPGPDVEVLELCDTATDGTVTSFLRHLSYDDSTGLPTKVQDTALDGMTAYTVAGTVGICSGGASGDESPATVLEECRCDDSDGDGLADTDYVALIGVAQDGTLTELGTYLPDLSAPYTPVAPVPCPAGGGAPGVVTVVPHRLDVAAGSTWTMPATGVQSVTVLGTGGTATVTTGDGTSTLRDGESVTWSVARDDDTALSGTLTVTAGTGATVTVSWTEAVTA